MRSIDTMKGDRHTDVGLLVLRLGLGLVLIYFGAQKALGVFGGHGIPATIGMFHDKMGIPVVLAYLAIASEFLGSLGVIAGLLTRVAAFGIACTMAVATFFNSKQPDLLGGMLKGAPGADPSKLFLTSVMCIMAIVIIILGPGSLSFDSKLFRKGRR